MKKIIIGLVALIAVLAGFVMTQPEQYRVERSITVEASAPIVFAQISDFKKWSTWSPWAKRDPNMAVAFGPTTSGVGAYQTWESETEGKGKQTINEMTENQTLRTDLEFYEPFTGTAQADFAIASNSPEQVTLTWGMNGNNNGFIEKFFYLIMDFDKLIGTDYEAGLNAIKTLSENATGS